MKSNIFTQSQLNFVSSALQKAEHIVLVTHMSPDGDAMGSSLGLAHFLRAMNKQDVTNIVPNAAPSFLMWMPGAQDALVYDQQSELADAAIQRADLIICTDLNELKRIGAVGQAIQQHILQGCPWIIIDHHLTQGVTLPPEQGIAIIDPSIPAASVLVYMLTQSLQTLNSPTGVQSTDCNFQFSIFNLQSATCLYTGIMTDTGNFSFNSNYPYLYHIIAELVELGVDKDACYNAVFNQHSTSRMRMVGYCLYQKMRTFPEYHTALISLSRKELYRFDFQSGDAEGIVNMPLQISDIYYSCFMREDKLAPWEKKLHPEAKTKVKISLRSQGNRPVNIFAHDIFNGGGHANASGGEYYGTSITDAVQKFLDNYQQYFTRD